MLNIYEADGGRIQSLGAKGRDGRREDIGRDRVSALMDNDSPESQNKSLYNCFNNVKTTMGLLSIKEIEREREGGKPTEK